jgi:diguanylate cyclase (GGDEF)-like protein
VQLGAWHSMLFWRNSCLKSPGWLVAFLYCQGLFSQPLPRYVFQPLPERLDISTATVTALAQDRDGFLWLGTQQGVLRYDGGRITRFGRESGLPTLFIDQLEVAADGHVWVGTNDGIARYNNGKFERIPIPVSGAHFESSFQILATDNSGGVYVGTNLGLLRFDQQNPSNFRLWTRKEGMPADAVEAVFAASNGFLYFICGNRVGLLRTPGAQPEIVSPEIPKGPAGKSIAVLVDNERVIWVRTSNSLLRMDPGASEFVRDDRGIPQANDFGIPVLDRSGQLMVPSVRGLFRRIAGQWEQIGERQGMESDAVFAAAEDREGAIWVGYGGSGVARWPGSRNWAAWTKSEGLPDNVVWCELRDKQGRLWVGTDNGLAMWEKSPERWRSWTEKDGLAGATVRQLILGKDGTIWTLSVPGGVSRIDPGSLRAVRTPMPDGIADAAGMAIAPDGRIWAGNYNALKILALRNGVVVYDDPGVPAEAVGTTSHPAFAPDGTLWTSGRKGISRFDGREWTFFTTSSGLRANVVPTVVPVSGTEAWFRYVQPLGLGHLTLTAGSVKVQHYTTKEGMTGDSVFLLGLDHVGRVWAGGNEGVNVIDSSGRVRSLNRADGLVWNDLSAGSFWEDPDGAVYMGTSRGLARFQASATVSAIAPAPVLITSAQLGGENRLDAKDPRTPHSQASFNVQFAELSLRDSEKTPCRYRLNWLEAGYTETLQREARYASLPSGSYRFEVSCRYPDGAWSPAVSYAFAVAPAWWEQWWAGLLAFVLIVGVLAGAIRLRTRVLEGERRRLEEAVAARSAELARANRELEEAALTDPLTKARNRRFFALTIEADAQRAIRSYFDPSDLNQREDLIFYLVDIDYFKHVNDEFGHEAGDLVLCQVAARLQNTIRSSDTLIRWGGEEFLIVARGASRHDASDLARRILHAVGSEAFEVECVRDLRCTCSAGWAAFPWSVSQPESHQVTTDVIQLVDRALYMAKNSGRNQSVGLAPSGDDTDSVHMIRTAGPESPDAISAAGENGNLVPA